MTYEDIIDEILESEGAEVNEADGKDKDGNPIPSKYGVLQTTLNWFHRVKTSDIPTSVYDLTGDHARAFYQWWVGERSGANDVPSWFSYMLADFYTQSGGWAIKILQKKAGVDEDGAWGPNTKQAVGAMFADLDAEIEANPHADNEFVRWYDSERRYFIRSLKRDDEKGIMARLDKVLRITLEQVEKNDTLPVTRPIVDIEIPEEFQSVTIEPSRTGGDSEQSTAPPADEQLPYHTHILQEDDTDITTALNTLLFAEAKAGYVLSTITTLSEANKTLTALGNKVLVVAEYNPEKADKLLNT